MKRLFTTLLFSALVMVSFAQTITGTVLDAETNEPLIGASVLLKGTNQGVATDFDGKFTLENVEKGAQSLLISYTGYTEFTQEVTVTDGSNDLGELMLNVNAVGLAEVNVIASIAVDRKTPVAVTTIKGEKIEALVGNQEYPEILRKTPSIYVTKQGGGFGDARINVRGFDQSNTAVMINGIPVNDMENGWVYWSNWAGLADVTSNLQVQRGLGATKLAVPTVGGSINIITNAADFKQGGNVSIGVGNDGYQKYGVMLSSGKSENGFAATAQFTHTRGDGYVDGTAFRAYSYFLSLSQDLGENQSLSFTVIGAPQWHHQRDRMNRFDALDVSVFKEENQGRRFNWNTGELNGEEFNWRRNFYHKPKAFLNHYWNINEKTDLKTSAYISLGRGGGTGARGRINGADEDTYFRGRIFNSFSGFGLGIHNEQGRVRWDDIVAYNQGQDVAGFGEADADPGTTTRNGDGFIRRASMNSHNWYGALSTLTHQLSPELTLTTGVDLRYYRGIHYRRLENLLGNDSYLSTSDINNPENVIREPSEAEFFNFSDNSYKDGNNVLNYWNDGLVSWAGLFAQLEYSTEKLTAFVSANGSNQGFKRIDYFNYLDSDPEQETDWQNFLGGYAKAGANYNIDEKSNIFFNTGFISRQPIFDNVFLNFRNDINEDVENQDIYSFELGYGFKSSQFRANINGYFTHWGNRQLNFTTENDLDQELLYNFVTSQDHAGIELEFNWNPIRTLSINGMASFGNWIYSDDFTARGVNIDTNTPVEDRQVFADGIKVGDAAQTTFSIGANYEVVKGLNVYADFYRADNLFAQFALDQDVQFLQPGGQVLELDAYNLVDAGLSYRFPLSDYDVTFRLNVNNVFDEWYISELTSNGPSVLESQGFVGFGRTWNAAVKFRF